MLDQVVPILAAGVMGGLVMLLAVLAKALDGTTAEEPREDETR